MSDRAFTSISSGFKLIYANIEAFQTIKNVYKIIIHINVNDTVKI